MVPSSLKLETCLHFVYLNSSSRPLCYNGGKDDNKLLRYMFDSNLERELGEEDFSLGQVNKIFYCQLQFRTRMKITQQEFSHCLTKLVNDITKKTNERAKYFIESHN